jgi:glycosyltransferase involved in cell wall biosynthesis
MKVVHINANDKNGGAGIAAYRHCEAMRLAGIDSTLLVLNRQDRSCSFMYGLCKVDTWGRLKNRIALSIMNAFLKFFKPWALFNYPLLTTSVANHPLVKEADLIYIHWVAGSMMSDKEVERILKLGKPVRWYMHDMNPITGGCHYSMDCDKFKTGCFKCPFLKQPLGIDLARIQYNRRLKHWKKYKNLEAYTPSRWLAEEVKKSALWEGHKVSVFPNVFNVNLFHPGDKKAARDFLNMKSDRKIILFGAAGVDSPYKGWSYLKNALNLLDPEKYEALIFGSSIGKLDTEIHIPYHFTGQLNDEYSLLLVYNAADVFVSSSLADNFPNVIMEAMACGLPCVGFSVGGIKEQIQHKINGYLVNYKDSTDLAEGIQYVCEATNDEYHSMQEHARNYVCQIASYASYQKNSI